MKKCYFCRGDIVEKRVRHVHQWGEKIVLFEDILAEVCGQCGEVYFAPSTVAMMDKKTVEEEPAKRTIKVPVVSFSYEEGCPIREIC